MIYNNIFKYIIHKIPSESMHSNNYTDKRTGIVYTNVTSDTNTTTTAPKTPQKHLDAFIPDTFLKNYFDGGKGKSWNDSITLLW